MKIKELINEMEYEILAGSEETEITTLVRQASPQIRVPTPAWMLPSEK